MSDADLAEFHAAHSVQVRPYLGLSGNGVRAYGPPQNVPGWLSRAQERIVAASGESVMSTATFSTSPVNAELFTLDTQVVTPDGPARVLRIARPDGGSVIGGLDRTKVWLQ